MKHILAVPILILTLGFPTHIHPQDEVAELLYNEGLRKYILNDFTGAISDFDGAYRLDSGNLKVKNMYLNTLVKQGNSEYERGDLSAAQRWYDRALALAGDDRELKSRLSQVMERISSQTAVTAPTVSAPERRQADGAVPDLSALVPADSHVASPDGTETTTIVPGQMVPLSEEKSVSPASFPAIVQVELPFDLDEFIHRQNEENKRVLDQIMKAQQEERENLYRNMQLIADSQQEDRQFFNRSLVLVLAGAGGIVLLPLLVIMALVLIRRRSAVRTAITPEGRIGLAQGPALLLEAADAVEETEYIGEEHYSEIVRAKRLGELYKEFVSGNLTWDVVSEYISEVNHELKEEILRVVERKIDSPDAGDLEATLPVLLPLITDEERGISDRSRRLAGRVGSARHIPYSEEREGPADSADGDDPLSLSSLLQIARLVDNKSGIREHSTRVAEISFQIAVRLADPRIDPATARKVALVHNIGYLDIDDQLFRYEGSLTEEQFEVVKSHPERGIRLLEYADPPEIFIQGIRNHHERLDGSGYPQGLAGEQIPLIARIIAVADSFAAATSPRPYRKALSTSLGLKMMEKVAGTLLDEGIFRILCDLYRDRPDVKP